MTSTKEFALTRSIYPYSAYIVICIGLICLGIFDWLKIHDPGAFEVALLVSAGFLAASYGDTRYRIFWRDGEIKQISANKYVTTIRASEITRIGQERSDLRARLAVRRPADRIAIYAGHGSEERHIDVSLRHFVASDIRQLLHAIHDKRPDLTLPKGWL
jgi:hypothetical protein